MEAAAIYSISQSTRPKIPHVTSTSQAAVRRQKAAMTQTVIAFRANEDFASRSSAAELVGFISSMALFLVVATEQPHHKPTINHLGIPLKSEAFRLGRARMLNSHHKKGLLPDSSCRNRRAGRAICVAGGVAADPLRHRRPHPNANGDAGVNTSARRPIPGPALSRPRG